MRSEKFGLQYCENIGRRRGEMDKKIFKGIMKGLREAIDIARGKRKPASVATMPAKSKGR